MFDFFVNLCGVGLLTHGLTLFIGSCILSGTKTKVPEWKFVVRIIFQAVLFTGGLVLVGVL